MLNLIFFVSKHYLSIKYYKKPDWMKEAAESKEINPANVEDLNYVFEIFEVYRVDGNTESLFRPRYR